MSMEKALEMVFLAMLSSSMWTACWKCANSIRTYLLGYPWFCSICSRQKLKSFVVFLLDVFRFSLVLQYRPLCSLGDEKNKKMVLWLLLIFKRFGVVITCKVLFRRRRLMDQIIATRETPWHLINGLIRVYADAFYLEHWDARDLLASKPILLEIK